uniref:Uncharacterized protein n=1 Tax=Lygus hesperus TaxID=30085 RepID=A0A0A9Y159_LYGHE
MTSKPANRTKDSVSSHLPTPFQNPDSTPLLPERSVTATAEEEDSTPEADIGVRSSEVESSSIALLASVESVTMMIHEEVSSIYESTNHSTAKYISTTVNSSSRVSDPTTKAPTPSSALTSKVPTTSKVQTPTVLTTPKHLTPKVLTTSTTPATKQLTRQKQMLTTELSDLLTTTTQHPTEPTSLPQKPETNSSTMGITFQVPPSLEVTTSIKHMSNTNPTIRDNQLPSTSASNDDDEDVNESTEPDIFTVEVWEEFTTRTSSYNASNPPKEPFKRRKTYVPKGRYTFSAVKSESKTTTYISLAVGILIFLSAAFFAGYVFRRRRSHLFRGSTEESDVLYMTSDEILDFNVARRPTASGTTAASSSQQILCQTEY